ncbi:conserved protein of unknown function [Cupriavidus taiwanensis]|uniref:Trypsin-like peptidase domain-containing protein n=1 Tax=Cupriavidus taiwanensis TaxID=164546 RepID=A0A9Q7USJ2_9BURK|nr:hypothetical protein [Cupriavidus taiwanensis]SPD62993.1 conserved protein of unknown function [Cupriavidus taiwanensis]
MSARLLFTKEEWDAAIPGVVAAMTDYLRPYRTAIYEHKGEYGEGWGSGSFLRLGDRVFILTNQHVACIREEHRLLAHQFDGQEDIRAIVGNHAEYPWPLDLAVLPVDMKAWPNATNKSRPIEVEQIALGHDPVPGELLAFTGFAGQSTCFHYNTLFTKGTCYTAPEIELPQDERFSSRFHFGLDYRPDLATSVNSGDALPLPPGLSGSTIWDTRFVAAKKAGIPWTPDLAKVTGVVWGWPSGHACLVATRAEFVRSFLLELTT